MYVHLWLVQLWNMWGSAMAPTIETVAIIGTGVVGRSWARVFSRAGCRTRLYDGDPAQVERALAWLQECAVAEAAEGDQRECGRRDGACIPP